MVITIPDGAIRQMDEELGLDDQGLRYWRVSFKHEFNSLRSASFGYAKGDFFEGGKLRTFTLSRIPGGYGVLSLYLAPPSTEEGDGNGTGSDDGPTPVKDVWSVHAVRNDVSVMAYCSSGSGAQRSEVEAWMKEPDGKLADDNSFTGTDGNVFKITNPKTLDLIDKIRQGHDSVIRFYPVITRKRTYDDIPDAVLENLSFIDTPSVPNTTTGPNSPNVIRAPKALSKVVGKYNWLKIDDSADEQPDGRWVRTESWMGLLIGERAWDKEFYGPVGTRWPMPRDTTGGDTDA